MFSPTIIRRNRGARLKAQHSAGITGSKMTHSTVSLISLRSCRHDNRNRDALFFRWLGHILTKLVGYERTQETSQTTSRAGLQVQSDGWTGFQGSGHVSVFQLSTAGHGATHKSPTYVGLPFLRRDVPRFSAYARTQLSGINKAVFRV